MQRKSRSRSIRSRSPLMGAIIAVGLSGCYHDPTYDDATAAAQATSAPPSARYPDGVLVNAGNLADVHGIYPTTTEDGDCCWTGPDVRFAIASNRNARRLRIEIYEPAIGPFGTTKQAISLLSPRGNVLATKTIGVGPATLRFDLPAGSIRASTLPVRLVMRTSFVPSDFHLGADNRRLTLFLRSAATE